MSESITIPATQEGLAQVLNSAVSKYDDKTFGMVASTGDYLPYLFLGTSNAEDVKAAKLGLTHYAAKKGEELTDLGKSPSLWVLAWRPKAMDMTGDVPLSYFDPNSEIFNKIKTESFGQNSRKMFGPEYLCWVPGFGFCAFFMGSKTARNEAKNVQAALPEPKSGKNAQPVTLTSKFIKTESYSWHGPVCNLCTQEIPIPDPAEVAEQLQKFLNPTDSAVQVAAPKQPDDRG
jgi:hypothetical protein